MRSCALLLLLFLLLAGVAAAADEPAGVYKGEYNGASGMSGAIRLEFQKAADGAWKCSVSFSANGQDVSARITSAKVEGGRIELRYEFEVEGTKLESVLNGELKGRMLEGKFQTSAGGNSLDEGTWKATSET